MKEKSSIHESHKAEFVANAILCDIQFLQKFSNADTVLARSLLLVLGFVIQQSVTSIHWKQAWENQFVIICIFL